MWKIFVVLLTVLLLITGTLIFWYKWVSIPTLHIPITASTGAIVFFEWAKKQIAVVTSYDHSNWYYASPGSPPDDTGVCSDVIWRAYRDMGIDFRAVFQADVKRNPPLYDEDLDPNINYRRVKRLQVYFSRNAKILTNDMILWDMVNLSEWQPGDIVIFDELPSNHLWHIGIISDIRDKDGVPYMLDNHGAWVGITITPLMWPAKIVGHYRVF
jgi:uncharacterized protein